MTASTSLQSTNTTMVTKPSFSVPRSYSDVISEQQLPGAIPEEDCEIGPHIVKQELAESLAGSESRTSVFSDYLPCGLTRFHFSLCFGLVGFVIFWLGLLLRIYLPNWIKIEFNALKKWSGCVHSTQQSLGLVAVTLWKTRSISWFLEPWKKL